MNFTQFSLSYFTLQLSHFRLSLLVFTCCAASSKAKKVGKNAFCRVQAAFSF
jgi:hypothetical protein